MEAPAVKAKKKPTKIEELSKEQIRRAILKKRESNAKAQSIVENLLEKNITEAYFVECLPDINQSHFEDIIEERAITRVCGYPLCDKPISEKDVPKQKYRISVKTNKVYDITGRKNFCSNRCYNSAMYVKQQMLTSPLWYREYEDIPDFHLLPVESTFCMGEEVDVSIIEKVKIVEPPTFTSINDFAKASLNEMSGDKENSEETDSKADSHPDENINTSDIKSEDSSKPKPSPEPLKDIPVKPDDKKKQASNPLSIIGDIIERPERKIDPILVDKPVQKHPAAQTKKVHQKKQPTWSTITVEVEKCLAQWFTLDTMLFLLGEEKVKEMVTDKGERIKDYMNNYATSIFHRSNSYDQYQALCRKLNLLELEDKKFNSKTTQREMKPLPDYSIIQEESKRMQLKVKAYLDGKTDMPEPDPQSNSSNDEPLTQLPLVDRNAQNAHRRRIVCQHLDRVLPDLMRSLGLLSLSVNSEVRLLVNTFKLSANNIMFKPIQWTLIAIIILKLLSLRDRRLEHLLEQPMAFQHMQLLLLSYKHDGGYTDRLISWLTDIDRLLDSNDTQLTVE